MRVATFCGGVLAALAAAPSAVSGQGGPYSFRDDFSSYATGSDGSPAWETGSLGWETRKGSFRFAEVSKDFALPADSPAGRQVLVGAELTLRAATGSGWKIAGVCVRRDDSNYWHLALVESPDDQGRRHFVELTEMLDGTWLAQFQEGTRLTPTGSAGQDFAWQYGRTYRVEIELSPGGITGTVSELDGTQRARLGYAFDARAVTSGRPGLTAGGFAAEFGSFSAKIDAIEPPRKEAKVYPPYSSRGTTSVRSKATGFFRVEKLGGVWWAIDPAGNGFFFVGTDHANYQVHWCEKLGYAPYHRNCAKRYGSEENWAESTLARLRDWGFNSLGVNSSQSLRRRGLPHMEILSMGTRFAERDPITPKTTWTGFPNVFSPDFERFCDKEARRLCAPQKDDPWLAGYFIDNELEWHAWTGKGPFADALAKPAGHSAKRAVVELLAKRHRSVESFNAAWGTALASLDDLHRLAELPEPRTDAAREDVRQFVRLAAERYFAVTSAAIRRHDPNHMVMGCRFAGGAPDIADIVGKYCDVVSVNFYRTVDLEKGVMADGFEEDLARWHEKTGRPIIVTEWSFPALDAGLPCKHGAGQRVPTQVERAFAFTVFQKLLFSTPFVVGSNYFMWADEPELGISSTFPEDSNYGLVNVNDEPYELLTRAATRLHALVYDIHSRRTADIGVRPAARPGSFVVSNAGAAPGGCAVKLWTDGEPREERLELAPGASRELSGDARAASRPGAHLFVCEARPEEPLLDRGVSPKLATAVHYVPGAGWHVRPAAGRARRVPVVAANPGASAVRDAVVSVKMHDLQMTEGGAGGGLAVFDGSSGRPVPFQVDRLEGLDELAIAAGELPARTAKAFLVYTDAPPAAGGAPAVAFRETPGGYEIRSGRLFLSKNDPASGAAFDRIELAGLELGRFVQLVWQDVGQNMWVGPTRVEKVERSEGPARLVLDVTASRTTGGETRTQVDAAGRPEAAARRDMRFRAKYRFVFRPGEEGFESRLLWIENTDSSSWRLRAYYHYLPSNIGGSAADDEPRASHWFDAGHGACLGVVPGSREISVSFWKDAAGGEHPDAARNLDVELAPGARYAADEPSAYVLACKGLPWAAAVEELSRRRTVFARTFGAETR